MLEITFQFEKNCIQFSMSRSPKMLELRMGYHCGAEGVAQCHYSAHLLRCAILGLLHLNTTSLETLC